VTLTYINFHHGNSVISEQLYMNISPCAKHAKCCNTLYNVARTNICSFLMHRCIYTWNLHSVQENKRLHGKEWQVKKKKVRSNYLFAPGSSTAMSSERFAFLHNQNQKKQPITTLYPLKAQHKFKLPLHFSNECSLYM